MKRKLTLVISLVLAAILLAPVGADAAKKKTRKKAVNKVQQIDPLSKRVNDPTAACNQGEEPLCAFVDKYISNMQFRKERSQNARAGYYDAETRKLEYFEDGFGGGEPFDYDIYFGYIDSENTWKSMFTPGKQVTRYGGCKNTWEGKWELVDADMAVYRSDITAECADGEGGGSTMQFTFQRKDGKWYLVSLCAAG